MKLKKTIIEFMAIEMAMKDAKAVPDFGFQIFVSRNLKRLAIDLEDIKKEGEPSEAFKALMQEFEKLRGGLAKQDEQGKPIIINDEQGQRYDVDDVTKFEKETDAFWKTEANAKLQKEHEDKIDKYRKNITETEIEVDLLTFNTKDIPASFFSKEENRRVLIQVTELMEELFK